MARWLTTSVSPIRYEKDGMPSRLQRAASELRRMEGEYLRLQRDVQCEARTENTFKQRASGNPGADHEAESGGYCSGRTRDDGGRRHDPINDGRQQSCRSNITAVERRAGEVRGGMSAEEFVGPRTPAKNTERSRDWGTSAVVEGRATVPTSKILWNPTRCVHLIRSHPPWSLLKKPVNTVFPRRKCIANVYPAPAVDIPLLTTKSMENDAASE